MYSHCLICRADLATNESIDVFPVGRRLAFDSAKGRLWVVCPRCRQWNLSPLEERWEAIEECERLFRDAKRKVQGEEIGLAKHAAGLELVRIGRAHRPEIAAWRYGTMMAKRRKELVVGGVAAVATGGLVLAGLPLLGLGAVSSLTIFFQAWSYVESAHGARLSDLKFADPEGDGEIVVTVNEKGAARLVQRPDSDGGWGVDVPYARRVREGDSWLRRSLNINTPGGMGTARFSGDAAVPVLARILPQSHAARFGPKLVDQAVTMVEEAGGPERWFPVAAGRIREWGADQTWGDTGSILNLPKPARLAMLIAAHEDDERRAMEGALGELEERWKEAEEIAAIADDLFLPASVSRLMAKLKGGTG